MTVRVGHLEFLDGIRYDRCSPRLSGMPIKSNRIFQFAVVRGPFQTLSTIISNEISAESSSFIFFSARSPAFSWLPWMGRWLVLNHCSSHRKSRYSTKECTTILPLASQECRRPLIDDGILSLWQFTAFLNSWHLRGVSHPQPASFTIPLFPIPSKI